MLQLNEAEELKIASVLQIGTKKSQINYVVLSTIQIDSKQLNSNKSRNQYLMLQS